MENKPLSESSVSDMCEGLNLACEQACEDCAEKIRNAPLASVAVAAAAGYLLHSLPAWRLAGGATRLALVMVKPALLIFGFWKITECLRKQAQDDRLRSRDLNRDQQPLLDSPAGPSA